jgi:hypothetical protein
MNMRQRTMIAAGAAPGIAAAKRSSRHGRPVAAKATATAAAFLLSAASAYAAPTTVAGTYSITQSAVSPTGANEWSPADDLGSPFGESLNVGVATANTDFFTLNPPGSSGCGSSCTETETVSAAFTFTSPSGTTPTPVTFSATFTAHWGSQTDTLIWAGSSGSGGADGNGFVTETVDFTDGAVLDIILSNAQDWSSIPSISFDLVDTPTTVVPEPASLALVGAALLGFGLTRRLRKRPA